MVMPPSFRSIINFNYRFLRKFFNNHPFKLLDIGSGNHSASKITRVFPNCKYYGLDINRGYNYSPDDFNKMEDFYEIDLTQLDYHLLPGEYFDAIWMVHVIEHLTNGEAVISELLKKLKPGGYFYIEYPGRKSTVLPSMYGTLNFYDDPSHVKVYSTTGLAKLFTENSCTIIKMGTRRNIFYILAMPLRVINCLVKGKKIEANIFWDITGFAEFIVVSKHR